LAILITKTNRRGTFFNDNIKSWEESANIAVLSLHRLPQICVQMQYNYSKNISFLYTLHSKTKPDWASWSLEYLKNARSWSSISFQEQTSFIYYLFQEVIPNPSLEHFTYKERFVLEQHITPDRLTLLTVRTVRHDLRRTAVSLFQMNPCGFEAMVKVSIFLQR